VDSNQLVGLLCSIERCSEPGGWSVVEVAVQARGVVPVDPAEGGQLDVVDGLPRALLRAADQFGLVVAVDCLSQRVVAVANGADRGDRAELGQPFGQSSDGRLRDQPARR
jgi:hypothetical protein